MEETTNDIYGVRMKLSLTAKGKIQWEISCKFPTLEEVEENMGKAIDSARKIITDKGLSEAGTE